MKKKETLKDGTKVTIKELTSDDLDRLMRFYRSLPEEDRKYLRVDVTDRGVVAKRIKLIKEGDVVRIVALHDDQIVADGALELSEEEWPLAQISSHNRPLTSSSEDHDPQHLQGIHPP